MNKYKTIAIGVKLILSAIILYFLYTKLSEKGQSLSFEFYTNTLFSSKLFYIALLLMPLNWGIEGYKWKLILKQHLKISYLKSFRSVAIGIAVSILTPNRNGEFIGRIFSIDEKDKIKATELSFINSWAQQAFTLLFGGLSLVYFTHNSFFLQQYYHYSLLVLAIATLFIILYITLPIWVTAFVDKFSRFKFTEKLTALKSVKQGELIIQLVLSALRYAVFTAQYILILNCFTHGLELKIALLIIPIVFLVGSYIPHFALVEFGIKSAVAVYIFHFFINDSAVALQTAFTVWFINVAVPALIGAVLLLFSKNN